MAFIRDSRRRFDAGHGSPPKPRDPVAALVRAVLLAAVGVAAATWMLIHHYTSRPEPMLVPKSHAAPQPSFDADAGEIPAPDLEQAP